MTSSEPRLVALDLDGTLLDPDGRIPERTGAAVRALRDAGVRIVLATGRSPWSTAPIADQLDLPGPHILMQGGLVASRLDGLEGATLWATTLDRDLVLEQLAFARDEGLEPILGFEHGYRAERLAPEVLALAWPNYAEGSHMQLVPSLAAVAGEGVIRTFLFTSPARHAQVGAAARRQFGERVALTWGDEFGIELLARGVSKGAALQALATRSGIPMHAVAAIGDGRNDLEMLTLAGRSAAMATAQPDVREAAAMVAPSNADEGILVALATWFPWLNRVIDVGTGDGVSVARSAGPSPEGTLAMAVSSGVDESAA